MNPTSEQLADYFRQANAQEAFKNAQRSSERYREILEAQGIDTTLQDPSPGLIPSVIDTLLTPGQWATGAAAKLTGTPGYRDLGFVDAAKKGADENLATGELLRRNGYFTDDSFGSTVARSSLGFAGDMLLDPLTYLTLGVGTGVKAGGKTLSEAALRTAEGASKTPQQLRADLVRRFTEGETDQLSRRVLGFGQPDKVSVYQPGVDAFLESNPAAREVFDDGLLDVAVRAENSTSNTFQKAAALVDSRKKYGQIDQLMQDPEARQELLRAGLATEEQLGKGLVRTALDPAEAQLKKQFGLADDVPLESLFQPPRLRLISPFSRKSADIPVVSNWSASALQSLDGQFYNARVSLAKDIPGEGKVIGGANKVKNAVRSGVKSVSSLFSTRLAAGSRVGKELIEEAPTAKYYAKEEAAQEVLPQLSRFKEMGGTSADLEQFLRAYQAPILPGGEVAKFATRTGKVIQRSEIELDAELEKAAAKYVGLHVGRLNERAAGLGDEAFNVFNSFKAHMDYLGGELQATGQIENLYKAYLPGMYKGMDDAGLEKVAKDLARQPNHTFAKTQATLARAEAQGLKPNLDLESLWMNRVLAQKRFNASKEFFERTALEVGLPAELSQTLKALTGAESNRIASEASGILKQYNFSKDMGQAEKMFQTGVLPDELFSGRLQSFRDPVTGDIITRDHYNRIVRQAEIPGLDGDAARLKAEKMGLHVPNAPASYALKDANIANEQTQVFDALSEKYSQWRNTTLGRLGELPTTRAGAEYTSEKFQTLALKNMSPEDAAFFKGELPLDFVAALESSLDTRGLYQRVADKYVNSPGDPVGKVAKALASTYEGGVRYLKKGALEWWPGYHAQNILSAPLLAGPEMNSLFVAMSPPRLLRTAELMKGNGSIVQKGTGITYQAKALERMAVANGMIRKQSSAFDLLEAHADVAAMHMSPFKMQEYIKKNGFGRWLKDIPGGAANLTESYGREHLFYNLVEEGWDPKSAATRVNELFTNYVTGKTGFEKTIMNNAMFFYSFAKAQTANTLVNLVSRPGAITQQLHALDAVKELLVDPNQLPPSPDVVEQAQSVRTRETLSRFIGFSDDGNPKLLIGDKIPAMSMSGLFSLEAPQHMTFGSVLDASWKSAGRTKDLWLASLTPPLKHAVQQMTGKNFYFDRPINDRTMRRVTEVSKLIPDWLENVTSEVIPGDLYGGLDNLLKAFLGGRDNGDGTYTASPAKLAVISMIPGVERAVMTMNAMGNPSLSDKEKSMRLFSGYRSVEVDPEKGLVFEQSRQLRQLAIDEGAVTSKKRLRQQQRLAQLTAAERGE